MTDSFALRLFPFSLPFPLLERTQRHSFLLLVLPAKPLIKTLLLPSYKFPKILHKMLPLIPLRVPLKMLPSKCPQPMLSATP